MATLTDYKDKEVPEPDRFFALHKNMTQDQYRAKIVETYGPACGRDCKMTARANAAVLAYAIKTDPRTNKPFVSTRITLDSF